MSFHKCDSTEKKEKKSYCLSTLNKRDTLNDSKTGMGEKKHLDLEATQSYTELDLHVASSKYTWLLSWHNPQWGETSKMNSYFNSDIPAGIPPL